MRHVILNPTACKNCEDRIVNATHILLIDDHRLFLDGMQHVIRRFDPAASIDEAVNGQIAINYIDRGNRYDLILMDLEMPGMNGFDFLGALNARKIVTPLIVVSGSIRSSDIQRALKGGALGFVPKSAGSERMIDAFEQVLQGKLYIPDELNYVFEQFPDSAITKFDKQNTSDNKGDLRERQIEVLKLMEQGLSNKQIASILDISEATVKSHIGVLFKSLGVKNRTSCIREGLKKKLINPSFHEALDEA